MNPVIIKNRIKAVVLREAELPESAADDVAFHMTDWLDDLECFARFCDEPDKWSDEEVEKMLLAFLIHVPNHVAAASKLLTGIPVTDIFSVESVENKLI